MVLVALRLPPDRSSEFVVMFALLAIEGLATNATNQAQLGKLGACKGMRCKLVSWELGWAGLGQAGHMTV